jgi:hypothetical protein
VHGTGGTFLQREGGRVFRTEPHGDDYLLAAFYAAAKQKPDFAPNSMGEALTPLNNRIELEDVRDRYANKPLDEVLQEMGRPPVIERWWKAFVAWLDGPSASGGAGAAAAAPGSTSVGLRAVAALATSGKAKASVESTLKIVQRLASWVNQRESRSPLTFLTQTDVSLVNLIDCLKRSAGDRHGRVTEADSGQSGRLAEQRTDVARDAAT